MRFSPEVIQFHYIHDLYYKKVESDAQSFRMISKILKKCEDSKEEQNSFFDGVNYYDDRMKHYKDKIDKIDKIENIKNTDENLICNDPDNLKKIQKKRNMVFFLKNMDFSNIDSILDKFNSADLDTIEEFKKTFDGELYNNMIKYTVYCHYKKKIKEYFIEGSSEELTNSLNFKDLTTIKSSVILTLFEFLTTKKTENEKNIKILERKLKGEKIAHILFVCILHICFILLILGFFITSIMAIICSFVLQSIFFAKTKFVVRGGFVDQDDFFCNPVFEHKFIANCFLQFFDEDLNNSFLDKIKNQPKEINPIYSNRIDFI